MNKNIYATAPLLFQRIKLRLIKERQAAGLHKRFHNAFPRTQARWSQTAKREPFFARSRPPRSTTSLEYLLLVLRKGCWPRQQALYLWQSPSRWRCSSWKRGGGIFVECNALTTPLRALYHSTTRTARATSTTTRTFINRRRPTKGYRQRFRAVKWLLEPLLCAPQPQYPCCSFAVCNCRASQRRTAGLKGPKEVAAGSARVLRDQDDGRESQ